MVWAGGFAKVPSRWCKVVAGLALREFGGGSLGWSCVACQKPEGSPQKVGRRPEANETKSRHCFHNPARRKSRGWGALARTILQTKYIGGEVRVTRSKVRQIFSYRARAPTLLGGRPALIGAIIAINTCIMAGLWRPGAKR